MYSYVYIFVVIVYGVMRAVGLGDGRADVWARTRREKNQEKYFFRGESRDFDVFESFGFFFFITV